MSKYCARFSHLYLFEITRQSNVFCPRYKTLYKNLLFTCDFLSKSFLEKCEQYRNNPFPSLGKVRFSSVARLLQEGVIGGPTLDGRPLHLYQVLSLTFLFHLLTTLGELKSHSRHTSHRSTEKDTRFSESVASAIRLVLPRYFINSISVNSPVSFLLYTILG